MTKYLLETYNAPENFVAKSSTHGIAQRIYSEDVASFVEHVREYDWLTNNAEGTPCIFATLEEIMDPSMFSNAELSSVVPIGSIDFAEAVLQRGHNIAHIVPIWIPKFLSEEKFLHRKIAYVDGTDDILPVAQNWGVDRVFIKDAEVVKCDFSDIYNIQKLPVTQHKLFVSEVIPIVSEWRLFCFRGRIQDMRNYSGDRWVLPDKNIVNQIISKVSTILPSYTIDVAVTDDGLTALVEIHNFISCGLYGANIPLSMYKVAWSCQ